MVAALAHGRTPVCCGSTTAAAEEKERGEPRPSGHRRGLAEAAGKRAPLYLCMLVCMRVCMAVYPRVKEREGRQLAFRSPLQTRRPFVIIACAYWPYESQSALSLRQADSAASKLSHQRRQAKTTRRFQSAPENFQTVSSPPLFLSSSFFLRSCDCSAPSAAAASRPTHVIARAQIAVVVGAVSAERSGAVRGKVERPVCLPSAACGKPRQGAGGGGVAGEAATDTGQRPGEGKGEGEGRQPGAASASASTTTA